MKVQGKLYLHVYFGQTIILDQSNGTETDSRHTTDTNISYNSNISYGLYSSITLAKEYDQILSFLRPPLFYSIGSWTN